MSPERNAEKHGPRDHHGHGHDLHGAPTRALTIALGLTASFMVVEAAVGWWSHSLALLADAGHMLADTAALALALIAQRWARKPRTSKSTFGHRRAEVLAAFVNGVTLALAAILIVVEAVGRWADPPEVRGAAMLLVAALGLGVNGVVMWILTRSSQGSINVRAALAHVLSDALGSIGAIVAGVLVVAFDWRRADTAVSVAIAVLVALSGWRVLRETTAILLESAPESLDVEGIEQTIVDVPGVGSVHDLHVWRISDRFDALTAHVVLSRGAHGVAVCQSVSDALRERHGITHATIQPEAEPPDEVVSVRLSRDGRAVG